MVEERIVKMLESINGRFDKLEKKVDDIKLQQDENTQILRALKDRSEVNKAEHDKMMMDIAKIQGQVNKIELVIGQNCVDIVYLKATK